MKNFFDRLPPGFYLSSLIGALMAGVLAFAAFAYYTLEQSGERGAAAMRTGRDLGAAAALARAADTAARAPVAEGAAGKMPEAVARNLDEARALLARHGLDVKQVDEARRFQAKPGEIWLDVAPGVDNTARLHITKLEAESSSQARQTGIVMLILLVVGLVLTLRLRIAMLKANGRLLKAATVVVEQIADGDLTARAVGLDQLHTRRLANALDNMTGSLRTLVAEVVEGAQTVAETSAQIAQGNLDLSQRTEEQATTLEETASSMEELTSTVAQNADNAREASTLAIAASDVARKGGHVVGQVVTTMNDISGSSRRIGDIIGVIDGIAFQTNILALNAAVEAARAGEQGRGFAVVAAEVRNLAQRSAAAAKEIKTLIGDSLDKVETGTKLVDAAGKTMGEIVASVKKVSDLIAEIAAASQEQSQGIGQINTAVAQMEQVVQQNASLVEEASAATESMKDQAAALLNAVSSFHLGERSAMSAPQPQSMTRNAPATIQGRPGAALPPAVAKAIGGSGSAPRAQAGQWEEF
jgi:methyl-accepting chemotaxis protein